MNTAVSLSLTKITVPIQVIAVIVVIITIVDLDNVDNSHIICIDLSIYCGHQSGHTNHSSHSVHN